MHQEIDPNKEWYILKSGKKFGPFVYPEMVHMMQNKNLSDSDFIWSEGMKSWSPLSSSIEFSDPYLKEFYHSCTQKKELEKVFFKRAHIRINFTTSIMAHNSRSFWTGKSLQISEGGSLLSMNFTSLLPGHCFYLNFRKLSSNDVNFNVIAEVTGKKFLKESKKSSSPTCYAVKFIQKDEKAQYQLLKWINQGRA